MNPTLEEATKDLADIRQELEAMRNIKHDACFLSQRDDCNKEYYSSVFYRVNSDIISGEQLEKKILELYPSLQ